MAITSLTIGGVEVNPLFDHFDLRETEGGVSTLACGIISVGSPMSTFSVRQPIVVEEDGERIFAGQITQALLSGFDGPNSGSVLWTLTAEDNNRIADRVFITETVADGTTLKAFLTTLVGYLTSNGVTLHGSQVDGPALPALDYRLARLSEVLQKLADTTGYLWRIDYDKKLRMWAPGDLSAPFDIDETDSPAKWTGDVEVETILGDEFANRVTLQVGPLTEQNRVESFTGDGVTSTFTLVYKPTSLPGLIHRFESDGVTGAGGETFGPTGTLDSSGNPVQWWYDASTNAITRNVGASESGFIYKLTFDGVLYLTASDEDAADIAANGLVEHVEQRDDVTTQTDLEALASQILALRLTASEQIVRYSTRYPANTLHVGQEQTITASSRGASGDYIISDLSVIAETPVTDVYDAAGIGLLRQVTAKKNPKVGKFQATYHDWLGGGNRGSVSINTGSNAPVSTGPASPFRSVQFNDSGVFGGDDAFVYYKDENSIVCGGGGSAITATAFESCQVFGYNNRITD